MNIKDGEKLILRGIRKAVKGGVILGRYDWGVVGEPGGKVEPDGTTVCGLGACLLGTRVPKAEPYCMAQQVRAVLGLNVQQQNAFLAGWDDGDRDTAWNRLADDLANEFVGPLEL